MSLSNKISTAYNKPDAVLEKAKRVRRGLLSKLPMGVGVQGSYRTGNIGDRAIAEAIKSELSSRGHHVFLFDKNRQSCNMPIRMLGGGGVLHDWYGTQHLERRLNFIENGGSMLAVGAPGFRSNRSKDLIREAMADVDVVTVRDERSREQIKRVTGVSPKVTACPAFLHQDPVVPSTGRTGVNFRPWFMSDEDLDSEDLAFYFDYPENLDFDDARRKYIENAREICDYIDNPVFIPFREKDEQFARKYLNVEILEYEFSVARTLQRVSSMDQIVAMRYHSLVFAAICRTPAVALAYEPKVGLLADRLGIQSARPHEQIGLDFSEPSNVDELEKLAKENFKAF